MSDHADKAIAGLSKMANDTAPATLGTLAKLGQSFVKAFLSRDKQIAELKKRIQILESRPTMKYVGIWDEKDSYTEGEFVTHHGSIWACREGTKGRPGTTTAWQLAVKHGRDAR